MKKHTCKTYFAVCLPFDVQKNAAIKKEGRECSPEEIGIFNKQKIENYIVEKLGIAPEWARHRFIIGANDLYDADVNNMIRVSLKDLFGKENIIRELQQKFAVTTVLEIVPYICSQSDDPLPQLSLDRDIIDFLSSSGTAMDLDYYVV